MNYILSFGAVLSLFGVLNGSVLTIGPDISTGFNSNLGYSPYGLYYATSGLFPVISRLPYGPSEVSYGSAGLSDGTAIPNGFFRPSYVPTYETPCNNRLTNEILTDFRIKLFKFMTMLYKRAIILSEGNFAVSIYTIWLTMAAIAEGTDGPTRQELFRFLSLPEDRCLRQTFYQLSTTRESPTNDVALVRNRFLITDSSVQINRNWETFARTQTDLNTISVPFKHNPIGEIELLKRVFNVQLPDLNLNGNSFLLETLDYRGLWTSAFSNAIIETGPFYNNFGEQIGTVEYMKIKQQAKIIHVPSNNMTLLELSVGKDKRYKMIFATIPGEQDFSGFVNRIKEDMVFESLGKMTANTAPIAIAIPKVTITNEIDVRTLLEDSGIRDLWTDPSATRNISNPAALPSSFIQRVSIVIDDSGVQPPHQYPPIDTGYSIHGVSEIPDTKSLKYFVANRPFMFAFFDSETYTALFAGIFSKPENYK